MVVQKVYEFRLWRPIELHSVAICSPCSNQPTQNRKEIHHVLYLIPKLFVNFFHKKKFNHDLSRDISWRERPDLNDGTQTSFSRINGFPVGTGAIFGLPKK